ncbi:MAG: SRPBCC family protein [Planctomyces sp.]|nr:SRPBCC family protein [Planctomyces sp.]
MSHIESPPSTSRHPIPMDASGFEPASRCSRRVNVSHSERNVSRIAGAALLLNGLCGPRSTRPLSLLSAAGLLYRGATGHCHGYEALGISTAWKDHADEGAAAAVPAQHGVKVHESVVIQRSPEDLFQFWKNLEGLPAAMRHLESVTESGAGKSHWVARGPMGIKLEWDAEIFTEGDHEFIAWRSLPGGDVDTAGSVHFRPLPENRGTLVEVVLKYDPPGGKWAARLASLLGVGAEREIREDLRRVKALLEAGAPPTVNGQTHGRRP